jgi:hypothetical protein
VVYVYVDHGINIIKNDVTCIVSLLKEHYHNRLIANTFNEPIIRILHLIPYIEFSYFRNLLGFTVGICSDGSGTFVVTETPNC